MISEKCLVGLSDKQKGGKLWRPEQNNKDHPLNIVCHQNSSMRLLFFFLFSLFSRELLLQGATLLVTLTSGCPWQDPPPKKKKKNQKKKTNNNTIVRHQVRKKPHENVSFQGCACRFKKRERKEILILDSVCFSHEFICLFLKNGSGDKQIQQAFSSDAQKQTCWTADKKDRFRRYVFGST